MLRGGYLGCFFKVFFNLWCYWVFYRIRFGVWSFLFLWFLCFYFWDFRSGRVLGVLWFLGCCFWRRWSGLWMCLWCGVLFSVVRWCSRILRCIILRFLSVWVCSGSCWMRMRSGFLWRRLSGFVFGICVIILIISIVFGVRLRVWVLDFFVVDREEVVWLVVVWFGGWGMWLFNLVEVLGIDFLIIW